MCGFFITSIDRQCYLILSNALCSDEVYCRETAIIREDGETPNDRNDRGRSCHCFSRISADAPVGVNRNSQSDGMVQCAFASDPFCNPSITNSRAACRSPHDR